MDNKSLSGKRILVTGAWGYLGSKLVERLEQLGAQLYLLGSPNGVPSRENEFCIDLRDADAVREVIEDTRPEIVFHLAASLDRQRSFANYSTIIGHNVDATFNLLEALKLVACTHFIFTSSSEVYGNQPSPYHEAMPLCPSSPYSLSKVYAEHLIRTHAALSAMKYTILRLFNFYGEGMSEQFFIPQLIGSLGRNEDFKMTKGEQYRDFLYVSDVVEAIVLAATLPQATNETFNVCSGQGTSLRQLAEEVAFQMSETTGEVKMGAIPYRENEIWEMIGSSHKINAMLEFEPQYTLQEGIARCIQNKKV